MARYRVDGMTCSGCAGAVTAAISRAAPGVRVTVDLEAGLVTVEGAAPVDTVRQAVTDAGFGFNGPAS